MLDIQFIRDNAELVEEKSKQKGYEVDIQQLLGFDGKRRELLKQVENLRRERNELTEAAKGQRPSDEQVTKGRELKDQLANLEHQLASVDEEFLRLLKTVPNMPTEDTPVGASEEDNQIIRTVGEVPQFDFAAKSDAELGTALDYIDKDRAAKVAGSRTAYLKGDLVRMQFALVQFVMDKLGEETVLQQIITDNDLKISAKPFTPILPPPMIRTDVYESTARLDREEVTYKLADDDLWLNASAEHSLAPLYMDEIMDAEQLPIRYLGYNTSFRREAGTYGKDMEGIFRLHHFDKLEMVTFSTAETSYDEHLFMVAIQEYLMQQLRLPYQVLLKCTADIGKPNARGVDINVWMPSQGKYRETHTADLITDYQARRLKTRVRRHDGNVELAHNNDGTAFAMSRILKAIMENYQNADGSVRVPEVLKPYMGKG